jgi:hypothetical protein
MEGPIVHHAKLSACLPGNHIGNESLWDFASGTASACKLAKDFLFAERNAVVEV